jgi:putative nucleotidyltransferase with HDIG domain
MHTLSLRDEVLAKAETVKILPTLNSIIIELFRVMNDQNSSFNQIFNILRYDQAISSKIISIANSAYYNRGGKISNLERAMIVIGFDEIKNIVMCLAYLKGILNQWKLSQQDLAHLWRHSLAVAYAAKILSSATMVDEPEKAFTVSILHDIGKVIFYTFGDQYRKAAEEARKGGREIHTLEKDIFGIDHQEVGYFISMKWRFPEEFLTVIRGHHGKREGKDPLLDLVRVADAFVDNLAADLGAEGLILQGEKERIAHETKRVSELLGVIDAGR